MSTTFHAQLTHSLGHKTKYLSELKKSFVRPLIQITVKAIEQEHIEEGVLDRISKKYNLPPDHVDEYYAAIYSIFKAHLRASSDSIKPADFKQYLQELKISPDCIEDISTVLYGQKRTDLLSGLIQNTKFYPRLTLCRWRIDITISSSILNRVLEPTIIMEWILNTGECHIFELSLSKFHQLRHTIASILVEMQRLDQNTMLKNIQCSLQV